MRSKERFVCVLDGVEQFRIVSPIFRQNIYSGVYDDLHPSEIPEDLSFFDIQEDKYPLMAEVEEHILKAELGKGDCIYVPGLHWVQSRTQSEEAMLITFTYESSSKYVSLLFTAIESGILDEL